MKCEGCGNESAYHIVGSGKWIPDYPNADGTRGRKDEWCNRCGSLANFALPDVWCPNGGYFDENLCDAQHPKGQHVGSKKHKTEILKRLNLRETGDMKNPVTGKVTPFISDVQARRRFCLDNYGG